MRGKAPFLRTGPVKTHAFENCSAGLAAIIMPLRRTAYRPRKPSDTPGNNGAGDPQTVVVDVSALGTFSGGTSMTIDKNTKATSAPAAVSIIPAQKKSVTLSGYAVAFLELKP